MVDVAKRRAHVWGGSGEGANRERSWGGGAAGGEGFEGEGEKCRGVGVKRGISNPGTNLRLASCRRALGIRVRT